MSYNSGHQPSSFKLLPDVVKNLIIINVLFFLAKMVLGRFDLDNILGLHYFGSSDFKVYQLVTYMFMHGGLSHIFFNMFAVWMFGSAIENYWGPKRFLIYYLITGFGAALIHYTVLYFQMAPDLNAMESIIAAPSFESIEAFATHHRFQVSEYSTGDIWTGFNKFQQDYARLTLNPTNTSALNSCSDFINTYFEYYKNQPVIVGASGSLFGILLAFGMLFPNTALYMMFIPIPIKAKYFVFGYGALELISGIQNSAGDNVAHFAHLGGMLFGFILIKYWKKIGELN